MKRWILILLGLLMAFSLRAHEEDVPIADIIFEHIGDAYEWHITSIKDKPVAIHLPVIVRSRTTGWHVFSSAKLAHGAEYEGFVSAPDDP